MPYNFINGWQKPVFTIYQLIGGRIIKIDTIELPIVNSDGLIETAIDLKTSHELLNYTLEQDVHGWRIKWTLPYNEYANVDTMMKIQQILRYHKAGYMIWLTPRKDNPTRRFEVIFTGGEVSYGIKRGGAGSVGNNGVELEFTTKYLIEDLAWIDPNAIIYACWYNHNPLNVYVAP